MATTAQTRATDQAQAIETNEFSSLLQKEFKPKTDQARDAVENAVRTLAEQALASSVTMSADAYKTVQAIMWSPIARRPSITRFIRCKE